MNCHPVSSASKPPSTPVFLAATVAAAQLRLGFTSPSKLSPLCSCHQVMEQWPHSDVTHSWMKGLIKKGLLRARTAANEWLVPDNEDEPMLQDGYVVSFVPFHECGLAMPHYYDIELQHLNPNGI
jgi:hypothetical protein